jgi:Chromo (CHRromatin Organisation MOdifier) domain
VAVHVYGYNTQVHSSTGLSPLELILSRPPVAPIMETRPFTTSGKSKMEFRKGVLATVQELSRRTREKLQQAQSRYKAVYDAHVRQRNAEITAGDLAFVKTYADPGGLSPKLLSPASGPYAVIARTERSFKVRTMTRDMWVNSDRVTKAPVPDDLPEGVRYMSDDGRDGSLSESEDDLEDIGDTGEYVVDRLIQHSYKEGELHFRVRWFGYGVEDDTWEPWSALPEDIVNSYLRKRHVPLRD